MKYIDSEKLIAALEKEQQNIDEISAKHGGKNSFRMGRQAEVDSFRRVIASLQQDPRFPLYDNIVEKVFGAGNLEGWERDEAEMLVALAKEELLKSLQQEQPEVFDTVAFQKGVQEGRRLEREDALTVADIEKLHTFLYAVKNGKHGAFTFTRLTDEQYEEVLRRFNNARTEE